MWLRRIWLTAKQSQLVCGSWAIWRSPRRSTKKPRGYLDEAVKQSPDDLGLQVEAAIAWFRRNDVAKAKAQIEAVLAKEPDNARAHNVLGRIYLFEGNPPASIKELNAAVAQQADFETVYFLGIAYLKAKKVPEAAELFTKLQASAGNSAALHVLFGRAYIVTHFPEPAVAEFRKAVELDPKYPRAHSLLGYAYLDHLNEQGYPLARSMFQQELKIQPDDYLTLVLLGLTDVSLRDYSAAETVLLHASARPSRRRGAVSLSWRSIHLDATNQGSRNRASEVCFPGSQS